MYWSYVLTAGGILGIYLAGKKNLYGWALGTFMQLLWIAYAVQTKQYGFILSAVAYGTVYGMNFYKWRNDAPAKQKSRRIDYKARHQTSGQKDCPSSYEVKLQDPTMKKEDNEH